MQVLIRTPSPKSYANMFFEGHLFILNGDSNPVVGQGGVVGSLGIILLTSDE